MLNVSTLAGIRESSSDSLRYGMFKRRASSPAASKDARAFKTAYERHPVVVWNITKACNLACRHCYASARARPDPRELGPAEAVGVIESLASYAIPALLLSGGEPTARPDFCEILEKASDSGLKVTISTNGTLIDRALAHRIAKTGASYVGVSLDGPAQLHDRLRCVSGAFERSVAALRALGEVGVRRGVRFTITPWTIEGLSHVLDTVARLQVERFCLYHFVPAGRGQTLRDITPRQRLEALYEVFEFAASHPEVEVLTVANPSDAVALCRWLESRNPTRVHAALEMLTWNGGSRNGSGVGLACIDEQGLVYPDQFSRHRPIGSLRKEPFDVLWNRWKKEREAFGTKTLLPSKCLSCPHLTICGGGFRARAELTTGDPAGFDPSCVADEVAKEAA